MSQQENRIQLIIQFYVRKCISEIMPCKLWENYNVQKMEASFLFHLVNFNQKKKEEKKIFLAECCGWRPRNERKQAKDFNSLPPY